MNWLPAHLSDFPEPELSDSPNVIAVGGDLSPERLLLAYRKGIFPWYNEEQEPILWWSPDPRMVLFPDELKIAKSMRPYFNQQKFTVTYDTAFESVMRACMDLRRNGEWGTWINEDMVKSYTALHRMGFAHSVEVWQGAELVGGLYGVAYKRIFFGESMFTKVANASKFGFISWVQKLKEAGFILIDCQQETQHLTSLGGRLISRKEFMRYIRTNLNNDY
jgi:leucyl/phenylalanyl-tRNA--protein transferase